MVADNQRGRDQGKQLVAVLLACWKTLGVVLGLGITRKSQVIYNALSKRKSGHSWNCTRF
jgi:hypothetical protein